MAQPLNKYAISIGNISVIHEAFDKPSAEVRLIVLHDLIELMSAKEELTFEEIADVNFNFGNEKTQQIELEPKARIEITEPKKKQDRMFC